MQEYGIIEKLPKTAAPEPVKPKEEAVKPPVSKQEISSGTNEAWKSQFKHPPVGSYEMEVGTSLKLEQTPE